MARGQGEGSIRQRTRSDGTVFWEARVTVNGKRLSFYDDSKSGALKKARAARTDSERGVVAPREDITVAQHLADWLENHVRITVRHQTYRSYRTHCERYIIPALGSIRLVNLTPGQVQTMLGALIRRGLSETTVAHARATFSSALKQAQLDHGLLRNAAALAKVPKSDRPKFMPEVITPDEARRIIASFQGSRLEPLVMFAAATGLRQGEMLALRWEDIDMKQRTLTVTHSVDLRDGHRELARPKTEKAQRTLALPAMALRALEIRSVHAQADCMLAGDKWQGGDVVFANPTGGIRSGSTLTHLFRQHLVRRDLEPIRWHALRRVFAAVLQADGVPLQEIRDLMGHSVISVTESYAYTMPERLHEAMSSVDALFGSLDEFEDESDLNGSLGGSSTASEDASDAHTPARTPQSNRGTNGVRPPE